jgi:hypothetical protein
MKSSQQADDLTEKLHKQLQETEAWVDGKETPRIEWFENLVVAHQRQHRLKRNRELLMFLFIAIWIVSGLLLMLALQPAWFIALQGILMFVLAAPLLQTYYTRKKLESE